MLLTGKIADLHFGFVTGEPTLSLKINEKEKVKQGFDELKDCEKVTLEIRKWRPKRSLDANAYCWTLMDKLAEKLSLTKAEVYRQCVMDIGGNSETVCVKNAAVKKICEGWRHNGLGWMTETYPSKIEGCTNVVLYYGSSVYDSRQMSLLIDRVVELCKDQGIDTQTPDQLADMLSLWGREHSGQYLTGG